MPYRLTEITRDLYNRNVATKNLSALLGGLNKIEAVTMTNGGSGYTSAPAVGFTGGGGTGAAGTAIVVNGQVVAVTITNNGSGYTSVPTVTFTGGAGTGAAGTATLSPTTLDAMKTTDKSPPFLALFDLSSQLNLYDLFAGTNAEASPTVIRPDDYAAGMNEKVWKMLGITVAQACIGIAPLYPLHIQQTHTGLSGSELLSYFFMTPNPASASSANFYGLYLENRPAGSQNYTATGLGISGITAELYHDGSGSVVNMTGINSFARKNSTGPVTTIRCFRAGLANLNASGTVTYGYGFLAIAPGATGTITNCYGVYIEGQKVAGVTNGYAFYQDGTSDQNYFAGKTVLGAGAASAGSAPLKWTSGTRMTTPEAGAVEYNNDFYFTRNGGTVRFGMGGSIFDHFADAGNTTTTETDLYSDTLPASLFDANGVKIIADYGGTFVSSGTATRQLKIYFGGTVILDTGALSISVAASWSVYVVLIRASSSEVRYTVALQTSSAALTAYAATGAVTGLTLTSSQILKITGTAAGVGASSGDITAKLGQVSVLAPA